MFKEINRKFDEQMLKDISDESVKNILEILEKQTGIVLKNLSRNGPKEFNRYISYSDSLYNVLLPSLNDFQPFPQDRFLNANFKKLACFFFTNSFEDGQWRFVKYHSKNKLLEYIVVGRSKEMYVFRVIKNSISNLSKDSLEKPLEKPLDNSPKDSLEKSLETVQMIISTEDLRKHFENIHNA